MRRAAVAVSGYVALRVAVVAWIGPTVHADTTGYRDYSISLTGSAPRPWVVSFLMQTLGDWGLVLLQALVGGVAFVVLAAALASQVTDRRVKIGIAAVILLIGLAPRVTAWDAMLLTESLAISLTALLIACLIRLDRVPWPYVAALFAVWVFTRDAHLYIGVILFAGICVWGWRHRRIALPAVMAATMLWAGLAYSNDDTIESMNVTMNVSWWAGTDVDTFRWFLDRGMPPATGFTIGEGQERFWDLWHDDEFTAWAAGDGQRLYAEYLATHPAFLFGSVQHLFVPAYNGETLVDHSAIGLVETAGPSFVWPTNATLFTLALVGAAAIAALLSARRLDRRWILPALLAASTVPHAMLAYHAAPIEFSRHGLVLGFVLVISCWWMLALALDLKPDDVHLLSDTSGAAERGVLTLIEAEDGVKGSGVSEVHDRGIDVQSDVALETSEQH